ncbi:uncharacterized protein LOC122072012 [Macadamia integrifolia]|uniref:uncharacterized protein LOC122072012 n=1 Tax=Macadamia integrifolia TaxID=60698 RepID=UPI001C4EC110|nr:uncharacterized protein LOC122072012 [Macadamia integrifolia]
MSPFQALYGREAPVLSRYVHETSPIIAIDQELQRRDEVLRSLKINLARTQSQMKIQADKARIQTEFEDGDWILKCIGKVAYQLDLSVTAHLHPVFHVSLKCCVGDPARQAIQLPLTATKEDITPCPVDILSARSLSQQGQSVDQVLV